MPNCDKCGREVRKVTEHAKTGEKLCLQCITKSGFFAPREEAQVEEEQEDRRGSIRVPITIVMGFTLAEGGEEPESQITYPAFSVDISTSGICFAWDSCSFCRGYLENSVHEDCIFHQYFIENPDRRSMNLQFKITKTYNMTLEAYAIYTLKEEKLGLEYIGAQFVNLSTKHQRMLEKIIIKYGARTT